MWSEYGHLAIASEADPERHGGPVDFTLHEHPRESVNWRRYRDGCPHYRVRWFVDSDPEAGEPMYQVFCLRGTPAGDKVLAAAREIQHGR